MHPAQSESYLTLPDSNEEREVRVRLTVLDVPEIELANGRFVCTFFLEASWLDGALTDADVEALDQTAWDRQFPYRRTRSARWTPKLHFYNILELRDREDWHVVYTHDRCRTKPLAEPVVCYRMRGTGVFRERFELHQFPFDSQDLQIQIVSMHPCPDQGQPGVKIKLIMNQTEVYQCCTPGDDKRKFTLYDEYFMHNRILEAKTVTLRQHSTTRRKYPLLILAMKVTRRSRFYLWHTYLPMYMLVTLTFPVLFIPGSDLSDRLSNTFALLLAAIAYKNWMGDILPRCSYLTELDAYVLAGMVIIFVIAMWSAMHFWLRQYVFGEKSFCIRALEGAESILPAVLLLVWTLFHARVYYRHRELEGKPGATELEASMQETLQSKLPERERSMSSVSSGTRPKPELRERIVSGRSLTDSSDGLAAGSESEQTI